MAEAYLNFLYTPAAQEIVAKNYYRPRNAGGRRRSTPAQLPEARRWSPSTRPSAAGPRRRPTHFADGGMFDQIYKPRDR